MTSGCKYETLLVDARRRVPYSMGTDKLKPEKPKIERLPEVQEMELSKEMEREFMRLEPSKQSKQWRHQFLAKLSRILNESWPGYDTKVHAFGSFENQLWRDDSDGMRDPPPSPPQVSLSTNKGLHNV